VNLDNIHVSNQRTGIFGNDKKKSSSGGPQILPEVSTYGYRKPDLTSFSQLNPLNMNYVQPNVNINYNLGLNSTLKSGNQYPNFNNNANNIGPFY